MLARENSPDRKVVVTLCRGWRFALLTNDAGGDEEVEVGDLCLRAVVFEEPTEVGDIAQAGDFIFAGDGSHAS